MNESVMEALRTRRSVRAYLPNEIPDRTIAQIMTAGTWAPTAGNVQPWYFYVIRDDYLKEKLAAAALQQKFIAQAPVVILVCADLEKARSAYKKRGEDLYCIQDAAAAAQNMLLAAQAMDLGACWVGAFDERAVKELLGIMPSHRPLAILTFGKPGHIPKDPGRLPLHQVYSEID